MILLGIVTNARITHATPGALYAHTQNRDWESDVDIPEMFRNKGCQDIAYQLVNNDASLKTNVSLARNFGHSVVIVAADIRHISKGTRPTIVRYSHNKVQISN